MQPELPKDIAAEKAVLGSCLVDREAIVAVRNLVAVEDFALEKHARVYAACLSCLEDKVPPDLITVANRLRERDELQLIGGAAFLGELTTDVPAAVHAPHYARLVAKTARRRRYIEHFGALMAAAYERDPDEVDEEARQRLELERRAGAAGDDWHAGMVDGADIWSKQFTPRPWVVEGILPAGVTLLHGLPKTNKSWLCKGVAYAVAQGGKALGHLQADRGEVLYLNLEMDEELLNERLRVMFPDQKPPRGVKFFYEWPTIDNGFFSRLENYITARPYTKLVIVDTLIRVLPMETRDGYRADARLIEPFTKFNANRGLSIVLVHHSRKLKGSGDPILAASGSTGITGSVDSVLELQKDDSDRTRGKIDRSGRRLKDDSPLHLKWDALLGQWCVTEKATPLTPERRAVVELLEEHGPMMPARLAALLDRPAPSVRRLLSEMRDAGQLATVNGLYQVNEDALMA